MPSLHFTDIAVSRLKTPGTYYDELYGFDTETAADETRLSDMKRSYALKLFAGGEEAQSLFASLTKELRALIKRD